MIVTGPTAARLDVSEEPSRARYRYRTPGAYVEFPRPRRGITLRRTDITGFVGITRRGPLHTPLRVESWSEFTSAFGGHTPQGFLAYAVEAFFANGGRTAWIVRVADPSTARAARLQVRDDGGQPVLELTASLPPDADGAVTSNPGTWAHGMTVEVTRDGERFTLIVRAPGGQTELWPDLSTDPADTRHVTTVLGDHVTGSHHVQARVLAQPPPASSGPTPLAGGADGLTSLTLGHFTGAAAPVDARWGIAALEPIDEIGLLAAPDLVAEPVVPPAVDIPPRRCDVLDAPPAAPPPPASLELPPPLSERDLSTAQAELIAQCERTGDRFALLDPPVDARDPARAIAWRRRLPTTTRAAAYFPWVLTPDPLRLSGVVRRVPPSGHVAGAVAGTDRERGVHAPPANRALEKAVDVAFRVDHVTHGDANEACLNIIRPYDGRGIRLSGARTLACGPPWRFINVRRLVSMIEEAISEDLAWTVFEPNGPETWREVDRMVRGFLDDLWRNGMLDGATAEDAYHVRCDEVTNPPDQRDLGRLTCLVGLRPPPPAEFVVVRVTLSAQGTERVGNGSGDA